MTQFDGERILFFKESRSGFMLVDAKTILKVLRFYARFTPDYTKIGFFLRKVSWPKTPPLNFQVNTTITGASSGLGKGMMKAAAEAGASVVAISTIRQSWMKRSQRLIHPREA